MNINIEDYLSHDEIKEIAKDVVKSNIREIIGGNKEYIFIQKLAKDLAKQGVQEIIPNFEKHINEHIKTEIKSLKLETFFWESFGWRSNGNKLINKILSRNESLIEAKVKEMFKTLAE